jgi:hypothetical protein
MFLTVFCVVLTMFVRFHMSLVIMNSTTIENMDKKMKDFPFNAGTEMNLL